MIMKLVILTILLASIVFGEGLIPTCSWPPIRTDFDPPAIPVKYFCFNKVCRFYCPSGYYLRGPEWTRCENYLWINNPQAAVCLPTKCPPHIPLVRCFARPCSVTKCPAVPDATCIDNYCGGCHAIFHHKIKGIISKEECNAFQCPPPTKEFCIMQTVCPKYCPHGQMCCRTACGTGCVNVGYIKG
ncbi:uncharacterized protein LOC143450546 [Clavelina lepadiformis]|uniref:Sushi domain-containing protein n=1 Tax=Clavelina lepadiformis TaxID=159417 RepID=A0ABP0H377_CLALP